MAVGFLSAIPLKNVACYANTERNWQTTNWGNRPDDSTTTATVVYNPADWSPRTVDLVPGRFDMDDGQTTAAVQQFLDKLALGSTNAPPDPIVRELLGRAVRRLQMLCANLLYRSYPRLVRPPLNLQTDEVLGAVVERLLKAMREVRPQTVRQFFALANQHIRWELNDLARRLDQQCVSASFPEELVPSPESSGSGLSPNAQRMLEAIDNLPEDEREAFSLVRIQGMNQTEVAELIGVSVKTVQRRLNRGLMLLTEKLSDLQ